MLQNEILTLLKDNIRIIIPDLGAIMVKTGNGGLLFNEFLKYDDGLLIDHVAKIRGIERAEAAKTVKKFTNQITKGLAKDKEYDLSPLGKLYLDENEKIQLKSSAVIEANTGKSESAVSYEVRNETQKKEEPYNLPNTSLLQTGNLIESTSNLKEKPMYENTAHSKTSTGASSTPTLDYSDYDRKSKLKIILISFAVLAIASVGVYFLYMKNPGFFKKEMVQTPVAVAKVVPKAEVITTAAPSNNPAPVNTIEGSKYHIIAGAFIVEKNATAFMEDLKKKGYDPKVVLKRNEYSFISIFSFPTFEEANSKFKSFQGSGMPVWIMKHKI